jgi:glycosyltransferase involved in cell wall biosynthesis
MRLLSLIHQPMFAGPHNHDLRLAKPLAANGVESTVLLPDEPGDAVDRLRSGGMRVLTYPSSRPRYRAPRTIAHLSYLLALPRSIRFVREVIREHEIDLLQVEDVFHPHGLIAARLERRPIVLQVVGTGGSLVARSFGGIISCRLATVIMTTGAGTEAKHRALAHLQSRVVNYFPPVDVATFRPNRDLKAKARAELGLSPEQIIIGYIARLHPEKDHYTFVRAASLLRKQYPRVRFVLLGSVTPSCMDYLASVLEMARAAGLEPGKDIVHKQVSADIAFLAQAFDIYWSTGVNEGATTAVGEAMALALPVVCTNSGSMCEMVHEGMTGYVVPPRDFEALTRVTIPLIENSALRKQMGRSAREQAVKLFSAEVCAAKHLAAYRTALSCFRPEDRSRLRRSQPPTDFSSDGNSLRARMR